MDNKDAFLRVFVLEHNLIDPQPGHKNVPGDPHYDDHLLAAEFCVAQAERKELVTPKQVHKILMRRLKGFQEKAGILRNIDVAVGTRVCPHWREISRMLHEWQSYVEQGWRDQLTKSVEERIYWVWARHIEYEHIHPFEDGNGRSGRLLMLNHALLLKLNPWYVPYSERMAYYARF